jgi:hypothetical protein
MTLAHSFPRGSQVMPLLPRHPAAAGDLHAQASSLSFARLRVRITPVSW